jgi:hypothetical protein
MNTSEENLLAEIGLNFSRESIEKKKEEKKKKEELIELRESK